MEKDLSKTALDEAHAFIIRVENASDVKLVLMWLHDLGLPVKCDPTKQYFISPSCGGAYIPVDGVTTYIAFDVHLGFYVAVTREQLDKMCAGMRLSTAEIDEDKVVDFLILVRAMLIGTADSMSEIGGLATAPMIIGADDDSIRKSVSMTSELFGTKFEDSDVYVPLRVNAAKKNGTPAAGIRRANHPTAPDGGGANVSKPSNENSGYEKYSDFEKGNVAKEGFHKTVPGLAVKNALSRLDRAIENRPEGTSIEEVIESASAIGLTLQQANEVASLAKQKYGIK